MRQSRRLSQRQLAQASGVASSMISVVEQNRTSPSIASLKKILSGMSVSLSEFFSQETLQDPPIFYRADELVTFPPLGGDDDAPRITIRQVGNGAGQRIQMLHEHYEPGADTGEDMYTHPAEEAGIVLSGHIEVTVGDEVRVLAPGDAYIFDSRLRHRFRNIGNEECIIISACTPPTF
jgi:transcriptional regulator with XRE-family HTH domain